MPNGHRKADPNDPPTNEETDPREVTPAVETQPDTLPQPGSQTPPAPIPPELSEQPEQVSLEELTARTTPAGNVEERITALQRVGYKLALYVLALIAGSTVLLVYVSFGRSAPVNPPGALYYFDPGSVARYERAVALYRDAVVVQREMLQHLFKDVVITAFLPTFTAILGYIFGSRESATRRP